MVMPAIQLTNCGDSQGQLIANQRGSSVLAFAILLLAVSVSLLSPARTHGQASVLTEHNDVARTGQNLSETVLTPANVNSVQFGKLFTQNVDGTIVGQPLYAPDVTLPDGTTHNVVYVATQHDSVFAFDAGNNQGNNALPLWTASFSNPANGITSVPIANYGCTGTRFTELGIMGTPVIDPASGTIYVVAKTMENGQYFFRLHALDITSGQEKFGGPVVISASVPSNSGMVSFNAAYHMQRPALLLVNGVVYIGFGSTGCDSYAYHGWLFAYDSQLLRQLGVFVDTPNGTRGAIWQAGGGPAADSEGNIYLQTANGTFDANTGGLDYGDSVLKLGLANDVLGVADYFTPFDQSYLAANDFDLGSGGVLVLPDQSGTYPHEIIGGGKEGTLYLVNRDNMGQFHSGDNSQTIQTIPNIVPNELDSVPAYWNSNVYIAGEGDFIKMFSLTGGLLSSAPVSETQVLFNQAGPGSVSISANGGTNGILWAVLHGNPVLYAFDATNLANILYSSKQALKLRDKMDAAARFVSPTVVNGKVYIGGKTDLMVYGLFPALSVASGGGQVGAAGTTLPTPLSIQTVDSYPGNPLGGISVTCKDSTPHGSFGSSVSVSDSSGIATTTYTLPVKVSNVTITCSSAGLVSAQIAETAIAGPATVIKVFSGNKQSAPTATALPNPLVVSVVDAHGNPISGVAVTFSDGGEEGSFSSTSATTDVSGHASTMYVTPDQVDVVQVSAATAGLKSAVFAITVTAGTMAVSR